jgi:phospholipase D3/4
VKELGVAVYNCPCLAADLKKLFDVYAELGKPESVLPKKWDQKFATTFNSQNPMQLLMNDESLSVYFTVSLTFLYCLVYVTMNDLQSSPPQFVPTGREHDGDSLVRLIDEAQKFVYISVMDYA